MPRIAPAVAAAAVAAAAVAAVAAAAVAAAAVAVAAAAGAAAAAAGAGAGAAAAAAAGAGAGAAAGAAPRLLLIYSPLGLSDAALVPRHAPPPGRSHLLSSCSLRLSTPCTLGGLRSRRWCRFQRGRGGYM